MKSLSEYTIEELIVYVKGLIDAVREIEVRRDYYDGLVQKRQKNEKSLIKYLGEEVHGEVLETSHKGARTRYAYFVIRESQANNELRKLINRTRIKYSEILKDFYLGDKEELTVLLNILQSRKVETYEDALYIFKKNNIKP